MVFVIVFWSFGGVVQELATAPTQSIALLLVETVATIPCVGVVAFASLVKGPNMARGKVNSPFKILQSTKTN